ncbi:hypothetical protein [Entomospira culicis]|uniref:Uncharacterized protein n=1 Tax=Entomospira culicis TaxID=2719989 RepID=A0A968GKM4_9SPIO|nr:hypothetical protein [Entomospira culicis]NIZ19515.1 hypothetical protein [Entomospira culicis]NIZ69580.1 hypothetical protein [Entomospira culicis]WDI36691.1 hypothetical protein PVA46_05035 [Entomospira culicis]WDI38320.1 hypothetical protein PVA47_05045 [Entomospira culicis]
MNKFEIQPKDFNDKMQQLKACAENVPSNISFRKVDTSAGPLGLFKHKVTGEELNSLTRDVQDAFIEVNKRQIESVKNLELVYDTINTLDKEYITGIVGALNAAEEASNQAIESAKIALETSKRAQENGEKIEGNSQKIAKTVAVQEQTIEVLISGLDKLEDRIDNTITMQETTIRQLHDGIQEYQRNIASAISQQEALSAQIQENVTQFMNSTTAIIAEHQAVIDAVTKEKSDLKNQVSDIASFQKQSLDFLHDGVKSLRNGLEQEILRIGRLGEQLSKQEELTKEQFCDFMRLLSQQESTVAQLIEQKAQEFTQEMHQYKVNSEKDTKLILDNMQQNIDTITQKNSTLSQSITRAYQVAIGAGLLGAGSIVLSIFGII